MSFKLRRIGKISKGVPTSFYKIIFYAHKRLLKAILKLVLKAFERTGI